MKQIKLWWYKRLLRSTYLKMKTIEEAYDCGNHLIAYTNPEYDRLNDKVILLFAKCMVLENK